MLTTNTAIPLASELSRKGKTLLEAAHEYWKEYQRSLTPCAVVWIEAENGHFVMFTRGEYKYDIIRAAGIETGGEKPLETMFEQPPEE